MSSNEDAYQAMKVKYLENKADLNKYYDEWAPDYEKNCKQLNYRAPFEVVQALKLVDEGSHGEKSWSILDLGAGSGLIGEELRRGGFKGHFTAVDYSEQMLEVARSKKSIYNDVIHHCVSLDSSFPLAEESVDVLIDGGCFAPNCAPIECLPDILKILRKGGYFVTFCRQTKTSDDYETELEKLINVFVLSKFIEVVHTKTFNLYTWKSDDEGEKNRKNIKAKLSIFRKL